MYELYLNVPLNSISVISGRQMDDDERLCEKEPLLRLKRFPLPAGVGPGGSLDQHLPYRATGLY